MANYFLNHVFILSLVFSLLSHSQIMSFPFGNNINEDDNEEYVVDNPIPNIISRGGRFLSNANIIKKGAKCDPKDEKAKKKKKNINVCNGVSVNGGKSLLYCCKSKFQDIVSDANQGFNVSKELVVMHRNCSIKLPSS